MYEKDRPFGVKLIFVGFLLAGLLGLYESIFASDDFISNSILNDGVLGFIGGIFNNISFLRIFLILLSFFSLWLASAVISLKRIGIIYYLFWLYHC